MCLHCPCPFSIENAQSLQIGDVSSPLNKTTEIATKVFSHALDPAELQSGNTSESDKSAEPVKKILIKSQIVTHDVFPIQLGKRKFEHADEAHKRDVESAFPLCHMCGLSMVNIKALDEHLLSDHQRLDSVGKELKNDLMHKFSLDVAQDIAECNCCDKNCEHRQMLKEPLRKCDTPSSSIKV